MRKGYIISVSTENELIGRAQAGDTEAFCTLARSYQRRIYSLALHYCRDSHDAEDLSQEVWLKAYRAIAKFRGDASFYTWLRQITINSFLNHRRETTFMTGHQRTQVRMEELDAVATEHDVPALHRSHEIEESLQKKMLVEKVMRALGELTPQQRLIFLLKHREGMTCEAISEVFGCSTGTVKKSLFRAVSKLRRHLGVDLEAAECAPLPGGR